MTDCITAISTALTALFAGLTYIVVRKQWSVSKPTIEVIGSGDTNKEYRHLSVKVLPPDDKKFFIERISIAGPTDAYIAKIVSNQAKNTPEPARWEKTVVCESQSPATGIYFTGPSGGGSRICCSYSAQV